MALWMAALMDAQLVVIGRSLGDLAPHLAEREVLLKRGCCWPGDFECSFCFAEFGVLRDTNSQNTSPKMACTPPHWGSCSFAEARGKQVRDWPLVCWSPSDWPKKAPMATPRKVLLIRGTLAILFTKMLLLVALEGCCSSDRWGELFGLWSCRGVDKIFGKLEGEPAFCITNDKDVPTNGLKTFFIYFSCKFQFIENLLSSIWQLCATETCIIIFLTTRIAHEIIPFLPHDPTQCALYNTQSCIMKYLIIPDCISNHRKLHEEPKNVHSRLHCRRTRIRRNIHYRLGLILEMPFKTFCSYFIDLWWI